MNGDHWVKIWEIANNVAAIRANGCAHRESDLERVDRLEKWVEKIDGKISTMMLLLVGNLFVLALNLLAKLIEWLPVVPK